MVLGCRPGALSAHLNNCHTLPLIAQWTGSGAAHSGLPRQQRAVARAIANAALPRSSRRLIAATQAQLSDHVCAEMVGKTLVSYDLASGTRHLLYQLCALLLPSTPGAVVSCVATYVAGADTARSWQAPSGNTPLHVYIHKHVACASQAMHLHDGHT